MSGMTFTQFITEAQHLDSGAARELNLDLVPMLSDIITACIKIADAINKGALAGTMGSLASENIQ
ncbi:MAG TPA: class 1 fructose-bisphosphatase, partial [Methylophilaceae bacterium]|nr:class 1 fructose-bisphosphatase [Methylophilaceae bacterium]